MLVVARREAAELEGGEDRGDGQERCRQHEPRDYSQSGHHRFFLAASEVQPACQRAVHVAGGVEARRGVPFKSETWKQRLPPPNGIMAFASKSRLQASADGRLIIGVDNQAATRGVWVFDVGASTVLARSAHGARHPSAGPSPVEWTEPGR